ncbi:tetratricopeptide repeat protein [Streptomyces sp. NPDC004533]|uniref:tetratricopeptide repeat protein n=1 Tax=Streptomyces sp. NPDC004533 TaxID=3154278 RepID=UPI0033A3BEAC
MTALAAVCAAALCVAVPAALAAAAITSWWLLVPGTLVAAVAGAFAPALLADYQRMQERAKERDRVLLHDCVILPGGQLPLVREVPDPILLGVHPARDADGSGPAAAGHDRRAGCPRVPPYVPRDIHERVVELLAGGGFILLIGESTAGKSRLGYEAMRAALPDHVLVAPLTRLALSAAIDRAAGLSRCVLWLDNVERFLGPEGLSRSSISRLTGGNGHHRVVIATIRSVEMARYTADPNAAAADAAALFEARETLEQAAQLRLARLFTVSERRRAQTRAWDSRIADALDRARDYGLAEYLAAGPELLGDWHDAWDVGNRPRAAALIAAAVDCRRAGLTRPLSRQLLNSLHADYLHERGGSRLRPESLEDAWAWATRQRRATTALLIPTEGVDAAESPVDVFDYLVDAGRPHAAPAEGVLERVFPAALAHADATEAQRLASTAHEYGLYAIGVHAYNRAVHEYQRHFGALHPKTLISQSSLAVMLRQVGRLDEAEQCARTTVENMVQVLGVEHPETLTAGNYLGTCLFDLGRLEEAESTHRGILPTRLRVLGPDHPNTLSSHADLALVLCEMGRLEEAEAQHRIALDTRTRIMGPEHPDTLSSRGSYAGLLRRLGRLQDAEREHAVVLEVRRRTLGEEHPRTLTSRNNLALVVRDLGRLEEARQEHLAVLQVRMRVLGPEHPKTRISQRYLASIPRSSGPSARLDT